MIITSIMSDTEQVFDYGPCKGLDVEQEKIKEIGRDTSEDLKNGEQKICTIFTSDPCIYRVIEDDSMADKMFKKFFHQRSILDSLRMYLDMGDDFMQQLQQSDVLTADDVGVLKALGYPSNRNELLQMLVRKQWNKNSFNNFCQTLKETQNENLTTTFMSKAETFVKASEKEFAEQEEDQRREDSYKTVLGEGGIKGSKMGLQERNAIMFSLKEKDDLIRELKAQNETHQEELAALKMDHEEIKEKYTSLDKAVDEMLASLGTTCNLDSDECITASLFSLTQHILEERKQLEQLHIDYDKQTSQAKQMELEMAQIKTEVDSLKKKTDAAESLLERERKTMSEKVSNMEKSLSETRARNSALQRKLDGLQDMFGGNIRCLEHDLAKCQKELREKKVELEIAVRDRDRARVGMKDVKDRTRKLLFTLGLTNDIGKTGMSLEHARNISYAIRRRQSLTPNRVESSSGNMDLTVLSDIFETLSVLNSQRSTDSGDDRQFEEAAADAICAKYDGMYPESPDNLPNSRPDDTSPRPQTGIRDHPEASNVDTHVINIGDQIQTVQEQSPRSPKPIVTRSPSGRIFSPDSLDSKEFRPGSASLLKDRRPNSASLVRLTEENPMVVHLGTPGSRSGTPTGNGTCTPRCETPNRPGSALSIASAIPNGDIKNLLCIVCGKNFSEPSNFDGACLHHQENASKMYEGTKLEVWSCCKSRKGCQRSRHFSESDNCEY